MRGRVITDERVEIRIQELETMQDISGYIADIGLSKKELQGVAEGFLRKGGNN